MQCVQTASVQIRVKAKYIEGHGSPRTVAAESTQEHVVVAIMFGASITELRRWDPEVLAELVCEVGGVWSSQDLLDSLSPRFVCGFKLFRAHAS